MLRIRDLLERLANAVAISGAVSFSQEVLLRIESGDANAPPFSDCPRTLALAVRLRTPCDVGILETCVNAVAARHAVLRSSFHRGAHRFVREIAPQQHISIERIDVADDRLGGDAFERALDAEAHRPFRLDSPPLFRAQLFSHGNREVAFLFTVHHLLFDPASRHVLCREMGTLYSRLSRGEDPVLPPLECSYDDYVARQRLHATRTALARWHARVSPPAGGRRPASSTGGCDRTSFTIAADRVGALRAAAAARRVTLATVLLGGYVMMASRVLDTPRVTIGVPMIDRPLTGLKHLIGLFMNVLVLPVDARVDTAVQLVDRVRSAFREALQDQNVPYGFCARDQSSPFDCTFDFMSAPECTLTLEGVDTADVSVVGEFLLRSAMALHVSETMGTLRCTLLFGSDSQMRLTGEGLVDELTRCFDAIAAASVRA